MTYAKLITVLILTGLGGFLNAGENFWSTNGPSGATVYTIEINPLNPDNIFIGTITNGIYKTTDGGTTWQHVDNGGIFSNMRDIAIHPDAPETLFAGTTHGLYTSADGGATWDFVWLPQFPHNEVDVVQYHKSQPNLIFAGTPVSAWKSYDGGHTWEAIDVPQLSGMISLKIAPNNPDLIYFLGTSMYTGQGVWKSEDRGLTWTNVQNNIELIGASMDIEIDPVDNNIVYIALDNVAHQGEPCLYRSNDGGAHWVDISPAYLVDPYVLSLAISPTDHRVIYAATGDNGVIKSEDYGDTWQETNNGLRFRHTATIEIDAANSIMYLGTIYDGIYKKLLNGEIWQRISANLNIATCYDVEVNCGNYNEAYMVGSNGIYRTEDLGNSWSYVNVDMPPGTKAWDIALDMFLPDELYACSGNDTFNGSSVAVKGFYRSSNCGETWEFLNRGLPDSLSYTEIKISYLDDDSRRIIMGSDGGVFYSRNLGESWVRCQGGLPANLECDIIEISPSNPQTIAAASFSQNRMFISYNRGDTWEEPGVLPSYYTYGILDLEFSPDDPQHIFATIYNVGIFESIDGGESWIDITNDLPVSPNSISISGILINPFNPANIFVASNYGGGLFQSHDGGQHWETFNTGFGLPGAYGALEFAYNDTTVLYFASNTRSVWSIHRTPTGIDDDHQPLPSQLTLSAYPNPFNAAANISFSLPEPSNVSLDIYDLLGRRTDNLLDSYLPAGNHSLLWHPEDLAAGVYIYRITTDYMQTSHKITLLK